MTTNLGQIGNTLGNALTNAGTYSARAAIQANEVSRQSQAAQGAFNQASADKANAIGGQNTANQYAFNSAMMQSANQYNANMWQQAANWNEQMWEKQAAFNAEQAQIQREWSERMENTKYQRAINDMSAAGLNPILAVTSGISTGAGNAGAASVGGTSMSSASAQMASGGLLNGNQASEGNYSGQMEYMGGLMGLVSAGIEGISSALKNFGSLGDFGTELGNAIANIFSNDREKNTINKFMSNEKIWKKIEDWGNDWKKGIFNEQYKWTNNGTVKWTKNGNKINIRP